MSERRAVKLSELPAPPLGTKAGTLEDVVRIVFEVLRGTGEVARYRQAQAKRAKDRFVNDSDYQDILRFEGEELDKILKADPDLRGSTYRWGGKVNVSKLAGVINANVAERLYDIGRDLKAREPRAIMRDLPAMLKRHGVPEFYKPEF